MELEDLSPEELRNILCEESRSSADLKAQKLALENEIQRTSRENERQEEKAMNSFSKKINVLKYENDLMLNKIQTEEEYVKNTLRQKLQRVLKEKENMEISLSFQESQVIERLQMDIDRMTQERTILESQLNSASTDRLKQQVDQSLAKNKIDPSAEIKSKSSNNNDCINDNNNENKNKNENININSISSLEKIARETEQTKKEYEIELSKLRKEIERLITTNSILIQRISTARLSLSVDKTFNETFDESLSEEFIGAGAFAARHESFFRNGEALIKDRRFSDLNSRSLAGKHQPRPY